MLYFHVYDFGLYLSHDPSETNQTGILRGSKESFVPIGKLFHIHEGL